MTTKEKTKMKYLLLLLALLIAVPAFAGPTTRLADPVVIEQLTERVAVPPDQEVHGAGLGPDLVPFGVE